VIQYDYQTAKEQAYAHQAQKAGGNLSGTSSGIGYMGESIAPPPPLLLEQIKRLDQVYEAIASLAARTDNLAARILGPVPECDEAANRAGTDCEFGILTERIDRLLSATSALTYGISRLERL
jgi:hypothetical protein